MKQTGKILASLAAAALVLSPAGVFAHHSYAMFNLDKTTSLTGNVVKFKWQNPHAWLEVDVPVNGKLERWAIEMTSPNNLMQEGWKRTLVKPGDPVTVQIHPMRNGSKGGSFSAIKLGDGTVLGKWS